VAGVISNYADQLRVQLIDRDNLDAQYGAESGAAEDAILEEWGDCPHDVF
jgi:hypothetical protein